MQTALSETINRDNAIVFTRVLLCLFLLGTALLPTQAAAGSDDNALTSAQESKIDKSFAARRAGDLDLAVHELEEALALGEHPALHLYLGELELKRGHCAQARDHLARADSNHLAWPTKDPYRDRLLQARYTIHRACMATVELTCGPDVEPSLEGHPVRCGERLIMKPGTYVIKATLKGGQRTLPRRIIALGAELTTLRLDPPDNNQALAHWVPTSPQPIPEQDRARDATRTARNMSIAATLTGALITGLSVSLLVLAYSGGDPADNPDPSLSEDEQNDEEQLYNAREAFGWGFSVIGAILTTLGAVALTYTLTEDEPNDTPGFSLSPNMRLLPLTGEVWGGGLQIDF